MRRTFALLGVLITLVLAQASGAGAVGDLQRLSEATRLFQAGQAFFEKDQEARAEEAYAKALEIRLKELAPLDETLGDTYHMLGAVQVNQDKGVEAERNFRAAQAIYEAQVSLNKEKLASVLNGLSYALNRQGRYDESEQILLYAIDLQRMLGPEKFNGRTYRALGIAYLGQRKYDQARIAFQTYKEFLEAKTPVNPQAVAEAEQFLRSAQRRDRSPVVVWGVFILFLLSLAATTAHSVWTHHTRMPSMTWSTRAFGVLVWIAYFGASIFLSLFAVDVLMNRAFADVKGTAFEDSAKLFVYVGFGFAFILRQVIANTLRRALSLPTVPLEFSFGYGKAPQSPASLNLPKTADGVEWFLGHVLYWVIPKGIFMAFLTDEMMSFGRVSIWSMNPAPAWNTFDVAALAKPPFTTSYAGIDVTSESFLRMHPSNGQLRWSEIEAFHFKQGRVSTARTTLLNVGALTIRLKNQLTHKLILLGNQDGDALVKRLNEYLTKAHAAPPPA